MPRSNREGTDNDRTLIEPISVRVPQAIAMTGFSRSRLYELIKAGELEIAKDGNCTLILVASLKAAVVRRIAKR